jgi:hypothetical protein
MTWNVVSESCWVVRIGGDVVAMAWDVISGPSALESR